MTKPAWKAENVRNHRDSLTRVIYGRSASESIVNDSCVKCGQPAIEFADEVSRREFTISGLCQTCQDNIFNYDEEEE